MEDSNLENSYAVQKIDSEHKDLIHDVSFDFFGKRMATCSSDQSVKVWDLDENGEWVCSSSWKTHSASVWRVAWAHPDFGQVLATCSFDRTAIVWEESVVTTPSSELNHLWMQKANLVDSRTSVKDVKFAPKHLGLQLATCSADGVVRIYEAPDPMNLTHWSVQQQLQCNIPCCCISWNPSTYRYHAAMIAVGSDEQNTAAGGKVIIFEYSDASRDWTKICTIMKITEPVNDVSFAPNMGRSYHTLAIASQELHVFNLKDISSSNHQDEGHSELGIEPVAQFADHYNKVTRLSWNDLGTVLLSTGDDGKVLLWMANFVGVWKRVGSLKTSAVDPMDSIPVAHSPTPSVDSQSMKNSRMNFRRFIPNRDPPTPKPVDPRYAGAYY